MSEDELLRRLGALAREQENDTGGEAVPPLDDVARERIVAHIAAHQPQKGRPRGRARVITGTVAVLSLAAAIAFAVTRVGEPEPLPKYALYTSGASTLRGPANTAEVPCVLKAAASGEASFELVAKTDDRVSGPVGARAFLVRNADTVAWPGAVEVSPQGSIRILDAANSLSGASELRVVIGRPEGLGAESALARARGTATSGPGWQVLRCAIEAP